MSADYIKINKAAWNNKTKAHMNSEFYDMPGFMAGKNTLNSIELDLLGDVKGLSVLHLQCHFGQDTMSFSRLGAHAMGVDFSDEAIANAKKLANKLGLDTEFICCDLYDLPNQLDQKYDIVFASYGTIGWLPDVQKWANIVSRFVKPGGQFVFAEFHPVIWMYDDDFTKISYDYASIEPIVETENGTYAEKNAEITQEYVWWNHGLSSVINGLISSGLRLESFNEHTYSPYDCIPNLVEYEPNKYRIRHVENEIPMVYSLKATKA